VIKSHGSADAFSFAHALERALDEARHDVSAEIVDSMKALRTGADATPVPASPPASEADRHVASLF
jgi:hypothetical protein